MLLPDTITLIELPLGGRRTVNAVLIEGATLTLVDTGVAQPASIEALERGLGARGYRSEDLQQVVITHGHTDHFGGACYLVDRSRATVVADPLGADILAGYPASFQQFGKSWIAHAREAAVPAALIGEREHRQERLSELAGPARVDRIVGDGDEITLGSVTWHVVSTPGHALSEVCFFEPASRTLISGDIVLGNGGTNVTLYPHPAGRPSRWIADILSSLDLLARLGPERILPGHGPEILDGTAAIVERARRVRRRLDEVDETIRGHPSNAWELSLKIYPPPLAGTTLGVAQTIGYLEALEAEGRIGSALLDGKRVYG